MPRTHWRAVPLAFFVGYFETRARRLETWFVQVNVKPLGADYFVDLGARLNSVKWDL